MPPLPLALCTSLLLAAAPPASAARPGGTGAAPGAAATADEEAGPPPRRADVVALRFGWTAPSAAKVTFRRTRAEAGKRPGTFTARYETAVERAEGGLALKARGTTWRGDLPYPPALAQEALAASEEVVQHLSAEGRFQGLDGVEALRPVLAQVLDDAKVPADQAERALDVALAATRAEAEQLWNLAVGFWTGADLRVGETYAMQTEAEVPFLPGARAPHAIEFAVRRRVPCAAGEKGAPRCVEAVLRATPDREALDRAAPRLLARLHAPPPAGGGPADRAPGGDALAVSSELVLVTEPGTLLPHRVAWTRRARLGGDEGAPRAELLDRNEWDWRWLPPEPPPRKAKARPRAKAPPPAPPAPAPAS